MRSILEAYYEPQFSDQSHGFRPKRGCHTALTEVYRVWKGVKWFVEGVVKGCFDNIDHEILLSILRERITDNRFLRLIESLLKAGYCEQWTHHPTLSGTPQGGIVSPILANIYLNKLDEFAAKTLCPEHTQGKERKRNPRYYTLAGRIQRTREKGNVDEIAELQQQMRQVPYGDPEDPNYRRLWYIRYADDFLLGFAGPKAEAETIKEKLREFLMGNLKLELSSEKTLITHATTETARFLGYELKVQQCNSKLDANKQRTVNGKMGLYMPETFVNQRCAQYMQDGKAHHRTELMKEDDYSIVRQYQDEYRGYVQYYLMSQNLRKLGKLRFVMESSLLKTLAHKHKSTVSKTSAKYSDTVMTPHGRRKCLKVIVQRTDRPPLTAYFGGIPLRRNVKACIQDKATYRIVSRTELVKRLLANECEVCGCTEKIEVHHIRKLADLKTKGRKEKPLWVQIMSARKRKTLVLCHSCHDDLHAGRPLKRQNKE